MTFLKLAFYFQGSVLLTALIVRWGLGQPTWPQMIVSVNSFGQSVVATIPLLLLLWFANQSRATIFVQIRDLLRDYLGPSLAACSAIDLITISLLAGLSEEITFRGVLEPWLAQWGPLFGVVVSNLAFGLLHAVTPAYAVLATLIGCYLSMTVWWSTEFSLVVPILCHALYDLVALTVVRQSYLRYRSPHGNGDDQSEIS